MADLHQHLAVSSPAYRRAREALRRLQEVGR
jgi:hypothetical protein